MGSVKALCIHPLQRWRVLWTIWSRPFWIVHCPWHPAHAQLCPLSLLVLRTLVFSLSTQRGPESGQKMRLQQAGEQEALFSPGTFFSHADLRSLRLYPFTDGWHPFVVAAELIYFLFLFYYMVVQVRAMRAQWAERRNGLILLLSILSRWDLRQEGKVFSLQVLVWLTLCWSIGPIHDAAGRTRVGIPSELMPQA